MEVQRLDKATRDDRLEALFLVDLQFGPSHESLSTNITFYVEDMLGNVSSIVNK